MENLRIVWVAMLVLWQGHARRALVALATTLVVGLVAGDVAAREVAQRSRSAGAEYVALGDSYSAGEGLGPYQNGTAVPKGAHRNQCHRSAKYAYAVLNPAVVVPQATSRTFFACSGATSSDMRSKPPTHGDQRQYGQPQQTATVGSGTRFVSLSAGGNDVGFGDIGVNCMEAVVARVAVARAGKRSCKEQIDASRRKLGRTQTLLTKLYEDLLDRAPQATVVVLGYPRILPATYGKAPKRQGTRFCVLDHYPLRLSVDVGMPVSDAKRVDGFVQALNATVQRAIGQAQRERPDRRAQLRYADSYSPSTPHNCAGKTTGATVNALQLSLGHGIGGPRLLDKLKLFIASSTLHPTKAGQRLFARVVQQAFTRNPPSATSFTRLSPVTDAGDIAPGFTVPERFGTGTCLEGSEVGQAYRCFADHFVLDPCYAVAEPGTGDGTSVVCLTSPFSTELTAIESATGLGRLEPVEFDEPVGVALESGARCTLAQGAHSADSDGRVIDYYCDDDRTVVLRGLDETGPLWIADVATTTGDGTYSASGSEAIVSGVRVQHDQPPANRPVTDAGDATTDELDFNARVHHEVDCGSEETTRYSSPVEQIYDSAVPCYEASLIITEWDNNQDLEPGWACEYDDAGTLLCEKGESVRSGDAPAFFSATHVRAIAVG